MSLQLCQLLRDKIKTFISERGESVRWFCRQSGVDYTTIYRLCNGEQKSVSLINTKKILSIVEPQNTVSILGEYFPDEMREVSESALNGIDSRAAIFDVIVKDFSLFKTFTYAATSPGATREKLALKMGSDGLALLDKLICLGAIADEDGVLVDKIEGALLISEESLKLFAKGNTDLVNLSEPGTHIFAVRFNLNDAGIKALYQASINYKNRLQEIENDSALKGNMVAVASTASGVI